MAILRGLQIGDFGGFCAGASRSTLQRRISPVKWSLNQRELLMLQRQAGEELRESQRLLRELTIENDRLSSEITQLRAEVERNAELRHEYGRIVGEKEDLERRFNAEPRQKIVADRDRYRLERDELQRRVNLAGVNSTSALAALEAEATAEIERLRAQITTLQREVVECNAAREELGEQSRLMAMQLQEAGGALAASRTDGAGLRGRIEVLQAEKRALIAELRGNARRHPGGRPLIPLRGNDLPLVIADWKARRDDREPATLWRFMEDQPRDAPKFFLLCGPQWASIARTLRRQWAESKDVRAAREPEERGLVRRLCYLRTAKEEEINAVRLSVGDTDPERLFRQIEAVRGRREQEIDSARDALESYRVQTVAAARYNLGGLRYTACYRDVMASVSGMGGYWSGKCYELIGFPSDETVRGFRHDAAESRGLTGFFYDGTREHVKQLLDRFWLPDSKVILLASDAKMLQVGGAVKRDGEVLGTVKPYRIPRDEAEE
jgi:hypothetical protein